MNTTKREKWHTSHTTLDYVALLRRYTASRALLLRTPLMHMRVRAAKAGINERGGYHAGHLSCDVIIDKTRGVLMAAGSATGGVNVWCSGAGARHMAELRDSGHPYGVPVEHLAAYPDGRFFISADRTTMKVSQEWPETRRLRA